jgi:glucose/arabinose dehydrogenase
MKNLWNSIASISILMLIFTGCNVKKESDQESELSSSELDSVYQGALANYQLLCAGCHGNKVMAFVDREWENGSSVEFIASRIREGDADDGMPPFAAALSEEEVLELAEYLNRNIGNLSQYEFEERPDITQVFESEKLNYTLEVVAEGMEIPWGMAFLPDDHMLITDRNGKMYLRTEEGTMTEVEGVPEVLYKGQGGLMDVELHPDFEENSIIYISYSIFREEGSDILSTTAIASARLDGNKLEELEVIFEALPYSQKRHHYGSRLEFDREGYLFFSVGDRGNRDVNPQTLDNHCGKIHRVRADGTIPEDNPFIGTEGAMPSIYSYGHRNPQGVIIHPETGEIWTHEHGPRGGDEINVISPGMNYGWPVISYGINYDGTIFTSSTEEEGMEQPLHYWVPSIAPCGMDFIVGDRYPQWEGNLLVGSLKYEYLNMCVIRNGKVVSEEMLLKNIGRLRNVKVGPDGYIYVGVEDPGTIYRLIPVSDNV